MKKFLKEAEKLPALSAHVGDVESSRDSRGDELVHYSNVFKRITDVLNKVDARQLFPRIIGESVAMRGVLKQIMKVAPTDSTALILGESGTGKELIATSIFEHSKRSEKPFVKINCAAMPEELLESELFGHEKGAFTGAVSRKSGKFEVAHGGTIFLDEIGDMPLNLQAKILRVLQEREFDRVGGTKPIKVDVRFIAATNKNLENMVQEGRFREDLYFRLNVFTVVLPPLNERKEDIPLIVERFLMDSPNKLGVNSAALQLLIGYSWPGNIRELQNTIERAAVMTDSGEIESQHLPESITRGFSGGTLTLREEGGNTASIDDQIKEIEKGMIIEALRKTNGIQIKAAEFLGINQRSLWHRVKKY
ncbi:MAG: sigma-54-dependent Fis family transcriptional regulator, partial [Desulfobacterales bacterium]|nr:sigma-54-dependent Fis family transcriptional regulator [Desulfobacterales bacterium]